MEKHIKLDTIYSYTSTTSDKREVNGTTKAKNESIARSFLSDSGLHVKEIRPILSKEQKELLERLKDCKDIDYYLDLTLIEQRNFSQLIWQSYVVLVKLDIKRKLFLYRIGEKANQYAAKQASQLFKTN